MKKLIVTMLLFVFSVSISISTTEVKANSNVWQVVNQTGAVIESGNGSVPQYVFDKYIIVSQNTDGWIITVVVSDEED